MDNADHFLTENRRRAFEHGVNTIALKVSSPMGKVFFVLRMAQQVIAIQN